MSPLSAKAEQINMLWLAKKGLLTIDDTGCPKPFARKTEGAKWQYCGPLKREEVCNVGVAAVFVSPSKHFPIDIVPYLPADEFPKGKNDSRQEKMRRLIF